MGAIDDETDCAQDTDYLFLRVILEITFCTFSFAPQKKIYAPWVLPRVSCSTRVDWRGEGCSQRTFENIESELGVVKTIVASPDAVFENTRQELHQVFYELIIVKNSSRVDIAEPPYPPPLIPRPRPRPLCPPLWPPPSCACASRRRFVSFRRILKQAGKVRADKVWAVTIGDGRRGDIMLFLASFRQRTIAALVPQPNHGNWTIVIAYTTIRQGRKVGPATTTATAVVAAAPAAKTSTTGAGANAAANVPAAAGWFYVRLHGTAGTVLVPSGDGGVSDAFLLVEKAGGHE